MTKSKTLYIAETDELGRVVCVWYTDETRRPKPLRRPFESNSGILPAQCFGAPSSDVVAWIEGRAT